jgi:hypothetical protein
MARTDEFYQGLLTRFGVRETDNINQAIGYQYDLPVTLTPGPAVGGLTQNFLEDLNTPNYYFKVIGPAERNRFIEIALYHKVTQEYIGNRSGITERMVIPNIRPYPAQIPLPGPYVAPAAAAAAGGNKRRKTKKLKKSKRRRSSK